jgi:DNA-binding XRE family transcriptional regulator
MKKSNIQKTLRESGRKQWELAQEIGISEFTIIRWLREPISEEHAKKIAEGLKRLHKGDDEE